MVNCFVLAAKCFLPSLSIVLVGVTAMSPMAYAQSEIAFPGQFTPFNNPTYCFVDSPRFKQPHIAFLKEKKSGAFTIDAEIGEGRVSDLPSEVVTPILMKSVTTQESVVTYAPETSTSGQIQIASMNVTPTASQNIESNLDAEVLFAFINNYRLAIGLPPFEKDPRVCEIAQMRAPELYSEIVLSHNMHAGLNNRHFPFLVTENIIHIRSEQDALRWWLHSPVHKRQMLGDYKYACTACSGKSCTIVFSNFDPK